MSGDPFRDLEAYLAGYAKGDEDRNDLVNRLNVLGFSAGDIDLIVRVVAVWLMERKVLEVQTPPQE